MVKFSLNYFCFFELKEGSVGEWSLLTDKLGFSVPRWGDGSQVWPPLRVKTRRAIFYGVDPPLEALTPPRLVTQFLQRKSCSLSLGENGGAAQNSGMGASV